MNQKIIDFLKSKKNYDWQLVNSQAQSWQIKNKKSVFELDKKKINEDNELVLYKDDKSISFNFTHTTIKEFEENFKELESMLKIKKDDNKTKLEKIKSINIKDININKYVFDEQEIKKVIEKISKQLQKNKKIIKDNIEISFSSNKNIKNYINSNNIKYTITENDSSTIVVSYIFLTNDNFKISNYKVLSVIDYNDSSIDLLIDDINKDIESYTKQIKLDSGKYKTVFDKDLIMNLIEPFFNSNFNGYNYLYEENKYKKLIGKKIFSTQLTITDKPVMKEWGYINLLDDQNINTKEINIIENGIFKTPITNNQSKKFSNNKSTGHDKSGSCSFNHLIIKEDKKNSIKDLNKIDEEFIVLKSLSGIHSGFDSFNGDFSLEFYGLYYKNNKLQGYIKQGMVAGNFVELVLNNIKKIYDDIQINLHNSSPSIELDKPLTYTFE